MADARERLTRLIELASENAPDKQTALAFELCDLLIDWPQRYPRAMREPFEALLEKVRRRVDERTRRAIAARLSADAETAVVLLNEFYFDVPQAQRAAILERNAARGTEIPHTDPGSCDAMLVAAARELNGRDFAGAFAQLLGILPATARAILGDGTGDALAIACKGAAMSRAAYSALVVLVTGPSEPRVEALYNRLAAFDTIPENGARRMLAHWRREQAMETAGARAA
jgi:hypothetical protein